MSIFCLTTLAQPSLQWDKNYNGPINGTDRITDSDFDPITGNIYVTGVSDSSSGYNYVTIKYSSEGDVIWRKRFTGPQNQDSPNAIKYDPVNNAVYVTGKSKNSNSDFDWLTIRYNATTGQENWTIRRNGNKNGDDEAIDLDVDDAGNIYVLGNHLENCPDVLSTKLIRYTPAGAATWSKSFADSFCSHDVLASNVAVNSTIVVVVYNEPSTFGFSAYASAYYISDGDCTSTSGFGCDEIAIGSDQLIEDSYDIDFDNSGYVYIAGGQVANNQEWLGVKKIDFEVYPIQTIWFYNYMTNVGAYSRANSIIVNQNNSEVYVTGYVKNSSGNNDIITIKYNNDGDTLWTKKFDGVGTGDDKGISIAKDNLSNPNIYVTGYSSQTNGKKQITTLKYNSNGTQLWSLNYGCTADDNVPVRLFRDPDDILYIAGYNDCSDNNDDYLTLKYCTSPDQAGPITGNPYVCTGNTETYSVSAINGATSYIWSLPSGWTGSSSTNSINAHCGASGVTGNITVKGHNVCNDGQSSSIEVTVNVTPVTPVITENNLVLHSNAVNGNQWYNEFGLISGANGQDYTVTSNGDYYDIVTLNGCSSAASNVITIVSVGIDISIDKVYSNIYPNPFSEELVIELKGNNKILNFEIFNAFGHVVFIGNLFDKTTIPTTIWSPGVYLIKLHYDTNIESIKLIKE